MGTIPPRPAIHQPRCACLIDRWLHFRGVSLHRFLPCYCPGLDVIESRMEGYSLRTYQSIRVAKNFPSSFLALTFKAPAHISSSGLAPDFYWSISIGGTVYLL